MQQLGNIWQTINAILQVSNNFEKLFDGKTPELEKVMDDENIISEFKNCNSTLMDYMKLDKYEQLVKYIIEVPPNEKDTKRAFKYPFVACELLTADTGFLYDMFLYYKDDSNMTDGFDIDAISTSDANNDNMVDFQDDDESDKKRYDDNEPNYRTTFPGKPKKPQQNKNEDNDEDMDPSMNKRVRTLEDKMSMMMNLEKVFNKQKDLEEKVKSLEDKDLKKTLIIQEQKEKIEQKNNALIKLKDIIKNLQDQLKESKNQVQKLKIQNSDDCEDLQSLNKDGTYLLSVLFSFLNAKEQVNITLAGYFAKIVVSFLNRKEQEMIEFIYSKPYIIKNLSRQMHSRSLAELLQRIISFESSLVEQNYFDQRKQTLSALQDIINNDKTDPEERSNCTYVIGETINKWQITNGGYELINYVINDLSKKMFDGLVSDCNEVVFSNSFLLGNMFRTLVAQKQRIQMQEEEGDTREQQLNDDQLELNFINKIKELIEFLQYQPIDSIKTSYGKTLKPLGSAKLKVIELIQFALQWEKTAVTYELAKNNIFEHLLKLFVDYEWNNVLHIRVEKIIVFTLESSHRQLQRNLFEDAEFIQFLRKSVKSPISDAQSSKNKQIFRKGYLGYITKIGNILMKMKENKHPEVCEFIQKQVEEWNGFVKEFLDPQNDKENRELGGHSLNSQKKNEFEQGVEFSNEEISDKYSSFLSNESVSGHSEEPEERIEQFDDILDKKEDNIEKKEEDWSTSWQQSDNNDQKQELLDNQKAQLIEQFDAFDDIIPENKDAEEKKETNEQQNDDDEDEEEEGEEEQEEDEEEDAEEHDEEQKEQNEEPETEEQGDKSEDNGELINQQKIKEDNSNEEEGQEQENEVGK